jgi:DUF4097 and DUF4098 domain-containing protein YvlB
MTSRVRPAVAHAIGADGRLTVKVAASDVRLVPSSDDHVRVRTVDGTPLPEDYELETDADGLSIRQVNRFLGLTVALGTGRGRAIGLEIEVPSAAETTIQTASGEVTATGLRGEQRYRSASGDIRLERAGGRVTTETVAGDVSIGVEDTVELIVKTVSGDVAIDGKRIERVRVTTTSGDIRLVSGLGRGPHAIETLSGDAVIATNSGIRIQARTVSGDLRSDLPHTSDGVMGRRSLTVGDGAVELSFRSVSGDLNVIDPAAPIIALRPLSPAAPPGPTHAAPDDSSATHASSRPGDERRLEILRALERGEIGIGAAGDQLARLDEATDA